MDFHLSEDQIVLQDTLDRFLEREYSFANRRRILTKGGFCPDRWHSFAELGLLAAALPESVGGLGGSGVETMLIMEAFGRHLVLEPFVATGVVGAQLLLHARCARRVPLFERLLLGDLQLALAHLESGSGHDPTHVVAQACRDGAGWRLSGRKPFVSNGAIASRFFVTARTAGADADAGGITLFMLDREALGVAVRPYRTHDGRTAAELVLDAVHVTDDDVVGDVDGGLPVLLEALDHGIAAVCAEAVGSCAYLIEVTAAHLNARVQYGSPLAKFQALQHRIADMYVGLELARAMATVAAVMLGSAEHPRMRMLSAAKVQVAQSARLIGQNAVQLHGGMGVSEELDVAHHFKRLTLIGLEFGDESYHLHRFAALADAA